MSTSKRLGSVLVILVAAAATAVGAAPSLASSPVVTAPTFKALIGVATPGTIPEVTQGKTIGYQIQIKNNSGSAINGVILYDGVDAGFYVDDDSSACRADPTSSRRMKCNVGRLAPGGTFDVRVAFQTPSRGHFVTNTLSGTLDAPHDRQTDTFGPPDIPPVVANLIDPAPDSVSTYALPSRDRVVATDPRSATHPQHTEITLPSHLATQFGTPVRLFESPSGPCHACIQQTSNITIPDSEPAANPRNPFTLMSPFTWAIELDGSLVPSGFAPTGVYHDGSLLPFCSTFPLALPGTPICVDAIEQNAHTGTLTARGRGVTNGAYQFG